MGLLDRFDRDGGNGNQMPDPDELKGWSVRFSPAGGKGGWASVEGWDLLGEPPTRTEFEINTGDLDAGRYRLFWVQKDTERLQVPPENVGWSLKVEGDKKRTDDPDLEQKVDMLLARLESDRQEAAADEQMPDLSPKELMQWMTLQNPEMANRYPDFVMQSAWDLQGSGSGLGFDDFEKNPFGALFYDAYNHPEKVRKAGENLGAGFGAGLDGFFRGMDEPEAIGPDDTDEADDVDEAEAEEFQPRRTSEEAAIDMEALAGYSPDLEDWVAANRAEEAAQDAAGAPQEPDAPDEAQGPAEPPDAAEDDDSALTDDLDDADDDPLPEQTDADDIEAAVEALE